MKRNWKVIIGSVVALVTALETALNSDSVRDVFTAVEDVAEAVQGPADAGAE